MTKMKEKKIWKDEDFTTIFSLSQDCEAEKNQLRYIGDIHYSRCLKDNFIFSLRALVAPFGLLAEESASLQDFYNERGFDRGYLSGRVMQKRGELFRSVMTSWRRDAYLPYFWKEKKNSLLTVHSILSALERADEVFLDIGILSLIRSIRQMEAKRSKFHFKHPERDENLTPLEDIALTCFLPLMTKVIKLFPKEALGMLESLDEKLEGLIIEDSDANKGKHSLQSMPSSFFSTMEEYLRVAISSPDLGAEAKRRAFSSLFKLASTRQLASDILSFAAFFLSVDKSLLDFNVSRSLLDPVKKFELGHSLEFFTDLNWQNRFLCRWNRSSEGVDSSSLTTDGYCLFIFSSGVIYKISTGSDRSMSEGKLLTKKEVSYDGLSKKAPKPNARGSIACDGKRLYLLVTGSEEMIVLSCRTLGVTGTIKLNSAKLKFAQSLKIVCTESKLYVLFSWKEDLWMEDDGEYDDMFGGLFEVAMQEYERKEEIEKSIESEEKEEEVEQQTEETETATDEIAQNGIPSGDDEVGSSGGKEDMQVDTSSEFSDSGSANDDPGRLVTIGLDFSEDSSKSEVSSEENSDEYYAEELGFAVWGDEVESVGDDGEEDGDRNSNLFGISSKDGDDVVIDNNEKTESSSDDETHILMFNIQEEFKSDQEITPEDEHAVQDKAFQDLLRAGDSFCYSNGHVIILCPVSHVEVQIAVKFNDDGIEYDERNIGNFVYRAGCYDRIHNVLWTVDGDNQEFFSCYQNTGVPSQLSAGGYPKQDLFQYEQPDKEALLLSPHDVIESYSEDELHATDFARLLLSHIDRISTRHGLYTPPRKYVRKPSQDLFGIEPIVEIAPEEVEKKEESKEEEKVEEKEEEPKEEEKVEEKKEEPKEEEKVDEKEEEKKEEEQVEESTKESAQIEHLEAENEVNVNQDTDSVNEEVQISEEIIEAEPSAEELPSNIVEEEYEVDDLEEEEYEVDDLEEEGEEGGTSESSETQLLGRLNPDENEDSETNEADNNLINRHALAKYCVGVSEKVYDALLTILRVKLCAKDADKTVALEALRILAANLNFLEEAASSTNAEVMSILEIASCSEDGPLKPDESCVYNMPKIMLELRALLWEATLNTDLDWPIREEASLILANHIYIFFPYSSAQAKLLRSAIYTLAQRYIPEEKETEQPEDLIQGHYPFSREEFDNLTEEEIETSRYVKCSEIFSVCVIGSFAKSFNISYLFQEGEDLRTVRRMSALVKCGFAGMISGTITRTLALLISTFQRCIVTRCGSDVPVDEKPFILFNELLISTSEAVEKPMIGILERKSLSFNDEMKQGFEVLVESNCALIAAQSLFMGVGYDFDVDLLKYVRNYVDRSSSLISKNEEIRKAFQEFVAGQDLPISRQVSGELEGDQGYERNIRFPKADFLVLIFNLLETKVSEKNSLSISGNTGLFAKYMETSSIPKQIFLEGNEAKFVVDAVSDTKRKAFVSNSFNYDLVVLPHYSSTTGNGAEDVSDSIPVDELNFLFTLILSHMLLAFQVLVMSVDVGREEEMEKEQQVTQWLESALLNAGPVGEIGDETLNVDYVDRNAEKFLTALETWTPEQDSDVSVEAGMLYDFMCDYSIAERFRAPFHKMVKRPEVDEAERCFVATILYHIGEAGRAAEFAKAVRLDRKRKEESEKSSESEADSKKGETGSTDGKLSPLVPPGFLVEVWRTSSKLRDWIVHQHQQHVTGGGESGYGGFADEVKKRTSFLRKFGCSRSFYISSLNAKGATESIEIDSLDMEAKNLLFKWRSDLRMSGTSPLTPTPGTGDAVRQITSYNLLSRQLGDILMDVLAMVQAEISIDELEASMATRRQKANQRLESLKAANRFFKPFSSIVGDPLSDRLKISFVMRCLEIVRQSQDSDIPSLTHDIVGAGASHINEVVKEFLGLISVLIGSRSLEKYQLAPLVLAWKYNLSGHATILKEGHLEALLDFATSFVNLEVERETVTDAVPAESKESAGLFIEIEGEKVEEHNELTVADNFETRSVSDDGDEDTFPSSIKRIAAKAKKNVKKKELSWKVFKYLVLDSLISGSADRYHVELASFMLNKLRSFCIDPILISHSQASFYMYSSGPESILSELQRLMVRCVTRASASESDVLFTVYENSIFSLLEFLHFLMTASEIFTFSVASTTSLSILLSLLSFASPRGVRMVFRILRLVLANLSPNLFIAVPMVAELTLSEQRPQKRKPTYIQVSTEELPNTFPLIDFFFDYCGYAYLMADGTFIENHGASKSDKDESQKPRTSPRKKDREDSRGESPSFPGEGVEVSEEKKSLVKIPGHLSSLSGKLWHYSGYASLTSSDECLMLLRSLVKKHEWLDSIHAAIRQRITDLALQCAPIPKSDRKKQAKIRDPVVLNEGHYTAVSLIGGHFDRLRIGNKAKLSNSVVFDWTVVGASNKNPMVYIHNESESRALPAESLIIGEEVVPIRIDLDGDVLDGIISPLDDERIPNCFKWRLLKAFSVQAIELSGKQDMNLGRKNTERLIKSLYQIIATKDVTGTSISSIKQALVGMSMGLWKYHPSMHPKDRQFFSKALQYAPFYSSLQQALFDHASQTEASSFVREPEKIPMKEPGFKLYVRFANGDEDIKNKVPKNLKLAPGLTRGSDDKENIVMEYGDQVPRAATSSKRIPSELIQYYFEVTITNRGSQNIPIIGVGLSRTKAYSGMPGWHPGSFGYHSDDGKKFLGDTGGSYGEMFGVGDVIGCWICRNDSGEFLINFIKNGISQGEFCKVDSIELFPTVAIMSHFTAVHVNFGQDPFRFPPIPRDEVLAERGEVKFVVEEGRSVELEAAVQILDKSDTVEVEESYESEEGDMFDQESIDRTSNASFSTNWSESGDTASTSANIVIGSNIRLHKQHLETIPENVVDPASLVNYEVLSFGVDGSIDILGSDHERGVSVRHTVQRENVDRVTAAERIDSRTCIEYAAKINNVLLFGLASELMYVQLSAVRICHGGCTGECFRLFGSADSYIKLLLRIVDGIFTIPNAFFCYPLFNRDYKHMIVSEREIAPRRGLSELPNSANRDLTGGRPSGVEWILYNRILDAIFYRPEPEPLTERRKAPSDGSEGRRSNQVKLQPKKRRSRGKRFFKLINKTIYQFSEQVEEESAIKEGNREGGKEVQNSTKQRGRTNKISGCLSELLHSMIESSLKQISQIASYSSKPQVKREVKVSTELTRIGFDGFGGGIVVYSSVPDVLFYEDKEGTSRVDCYFLLSSNFVRRKALVFPNHDFLYAKRVLYGNSDVSFAPLNRFKRLPITTVWYLLEVIFSLPAAYVRSFYTEKTFSTLNLIASSKNNTFSEIGKHWLIRFLGRWRNAIVDITQILSLTSAMQNALSGLRKKKYFKKKGDQLLDLEISTRLILSSNVVKTEFDQAMIGRILLEKTMFKMLISRRARVSPIVDSRPGPISDFSLHDILPKKESITCWSQRDSVFALSALLHHFIFRPSYVPLQIAAECMLSLGSIYTYNSQTPYEPLPHGPISIENPFGDVIVKFSDEVDVRARDTLIFSPKNGKRIEIRGNEVVPNGIIKLKGEDLHVKFWLQMDSFWEGVVCDQCEESIPDACRFKCVHCVDYDVHECCLGKPHDESHVFVWLPYALQTPVAGVLSDLESWADKFLTDAVPLDEVQEIIHLESTCSNCNSCPIIGIRWKCAQCEEDFNLCNKCFELYKSTVLEYGLFEDLAAMANHNRNHAFFRLTRVLDFGFKIPVINELDDSSSVSRSFAFTIARDNEMAKKDEEGILNTLDALNKWTMEMDEILVDFLDMKHEALVVERKSVISRETFELLAEETDERFAIFADVPVSEIYMRYTLLKTFNTLLLSHFDDLEHSLWLENWSLSNMLYRCRRLVFRPTREKILEDLLPQSESSDGSYTISLNRTLASDEGEESIFQQWFTQVSQLEPSKFRRDNDRIWETKLIGEGATDIGGPFRESITAICADLMDEMKEPVLFIRTPNSNADIGNNKEAMIPNPSCVSDEHMKMFFYVGILMGIAVRTSNPLSLYLPQMVWKQLCFEKPDFSDIMSVDQVMGQTLRMLRGCKTQEEFDDACLSMRFVLINSNGDLKELKPDGSSVKVTFNNRLEYCDLVETQMLNEFSVASERILAGLCTQIPSLIVPLYPYKELERLICGNKTVDIDFLKRHAVYNPTSLEHLPVIGFFWETLRNFNDKEKSLFLRFIWGRERLPVNQSKFTQSFEISKLHCDDHDSYLPIGHTCLFSLEIPMYSTLEITRTKLLKAINSCVAIDTDFAAFEGGDEDEISDEESDSEISFYSDYDYLF